MESTVTFEQLNRKQPAMQSVRKHQVNTGYYDMLTQLALSNKRRQPRQN